MVKMGGYWEKCNGPYDLRKKEVLFALGISGATWL